MVGLLHAMAFMVLLLIGWVIWNNKPLPLPIRNLSDLDGKLNADNKQTSFESVLVSMFRREND